MCRACTFNGPIKMDERDSDADGQEERKDPKKRRGNIIHNVCRTVCQGP